MTTSSTYADFPIRINKRKLLFSREQEDIYIERMWRASNDERSFVNSVEDNIITLFCSRRVMRSILCEVDLPSTSALGCRVSHQNYFRVFLYLLCISLFH